MAVTQFEKTIIEALQKLPYDERKALAVTYNKHKQAWSNRLIMERLQNAVEDALGDELLEVEVERLDGG